MNQAIFILVLVASAVFDLAYFTYHGLTGAPLRCMFLPTEWCVRSGHREEGRLWALVFAAQVLAIFIAGGLWWFV